MAKKIRKGEIDPKLLELLACPLTKGSLEHDVSAHTLRSSSAKLVYPVRDGIAVMLPSEAQSLEDAEQSRPNPSDGDTN